MVVEELLVSVETAVVEVSEVVEVLAVSVETVVAESFVSSDTAFYGGTHALYPLGPKLPAPGTKLATPPPFPPPDGGPPAADPAPPFPPDGAPPFPPDGAPPC